MDSKSNNLIESEQIRLQNLLKYPLETKEVDYKNLEKLTKDNLFSYKLIKHIMGMANAGGGYIVIGYKEDENKIPQPVSEISDEILSSYDPSTLAEMVESFISGEKINLEIYKISHPDNNNIYPIIKVNGFKDKPFFCKKDYRDELSQKMILKINSLYIRISSARTIELATPDQWNDLINQCVNKRQDDLLFRFKNLMKEIGFTDLSMITDKNRDLKDNKKEEIQKKVRQYLAEKKINYAGIEVFHKILGTIKKWNKKELIDAIEVSQQRNTGWPIGVMYRYNKEGIPQPTSDGIELKLINFKGTCDYWELSENGTFYFFRNFQEDFVEGNEINKVLWFDTRIWRILEAIKHTVSLYKALGVDPTTKILIEVNHFGINNRSLTTINSNRLMIPRESGNLKEVFWEKEISLDDLMINGEELAKEISKELFQMFEYMSFEETVLDSVIDEFNKSKVR